MMYFTKKLAKNAPMASARRYRTSRFLGMCFVIKNPTVTAGLKCDIEILPNAYTIRATAIAGHRATNHKPNVPAYFASNTTEPVASVTTTNVPMISAKNLF